MRKMSFFKILALLVVLFPLSQPLAQVIPPSSVQPGNVEKGFKPIEKPDVSPEPLFSTESGAKRGKSDDNAVKFELKTVTIEGATNFSEADIRPIYQEYIGRTVSLGDLQGLADEITAELRNSGYALSRAVIPPQKVKDGNVIIKVVGGFVNSVVIEGDVKGDRDLINSYAEKIRSEKPLNFKTMERYLLLMDDLPGVTARGYLKPAAVQGGSDLVIKIEHKMIEGIVGADNRGNKFIGPYHAKAGIKANSVLGLYEQTSLYTDITSQPEELKFFELSHQQQLGSEGTKLIATVGYTRTHPGSTLEILDIEGTNRSFAVDIIHPLIRSRAKNLYLDIGANYSNVESESPFAFSYEDNIRSLTAGGTFDFVDSLAGINRISLHGTKGFDIDVNNQPLSRANADQTFLKGTAEVTRIQSIHGPFTAEARVSGQYSRDSLFASEEFGVGGPAYGSAYDVAEITGDSGLAARGELQFNGSGEGEVKFLQSYQLYTFYDAGKVWNRNAIIGEAKDQGLTSAGLGTRFNAVENFSGEVELAFPLSRDVQSENDDDPRLFFNLIYRF